MGTVLRPRRIAIVVAIVASAVACSACAPPGPTATTTPPPVHVDLFGDSNSVLAHDDFDAQNDRPSHDFDVAYTAEYGANVATWHDQILAAPGPIVVLALGHNDWKDPDAVAHWRDVLDRLRPDLCVVWVRPSDPNSTVATANAVTAGVMREHPAVKVYPWRDVIAGHPTWYGPDGVHYSPDGQVAYASALLDAIALC